MRSDREEIPGGFTKEEADRAEVMEAQLRSGESTRSREAGVFAAPGCEVYWPAPFEVCGAIKDKYNSLGGPNSFLLWPKSNELTNPDGVGKRSEFLGGNIYWTSWTDAHFVAHDFLSTWGEYGYETGLLRYPLSDEIISPDGVGRRQHFEGGMIYWHPNAGANAVHGAILNKWAELGYEAGQLGYPTSEEMPSTGAWATRSQIEQRFERGALFYDALTNTVIVAEFRVDFN